MTDTDNPQSDGPERYPADPQRCTTCGSIVRVGTVNDNNFGAYCDCTVEYGRPMHHMNGHPWPNRWVKDGELNEEIDR